MICGASRRKFVDYAVLCFIFAAVRQASPPETVVLNELIMTKQLNLQDSLFSLMTSLNAASPYFVRCIKPNSEKVILYIYLKN